MDHSLMPVAQLLGGLDRCGVALDGSGGLIVSLAFAGLAGGIGHCSGMCGPFVLSQVAARLEGIPASEMREWHRLAGAAVLPYHLGRATTYAALGAAGAAIVGSLPARLHWMSSLLLLAAAILMLGMAWPALRRRLAATATSDQGVFGRRLGRLAAPLFDRPTSWRGYALGLLLGFIPCGLLYGALAAATATADPLAGALGMLAFSLGTMPSLMAVGLVGHLAGRRWREPVLRYAPLLFALNAGMLTWLAWKQIA